MKHLVMLYLFKINWDLQGSTLAFKWVSLPFFFLFQFFFFISPNAKSHKFQTGKSLMLVWHYTDSCSAQICSFTKAQWTLFMKSKQNKFLCKTFLKPLLRQFPFKSIPFRREWIYEWFTQKLVLLRFMNKSQCYCRAFTLNSWYLL